MTQDFYKCSECDNGVMYINRANVCTVKAHNGGSRPTVQITFNDKPCESITCDSLAEAKVLAAAIADD